MSDVFSPRRAVPDLPRRPGVTVLMAALLVLVTGAVTYALWNTQATTGAVIASGNLSIEPDGPMMWGCAEQCEEQAALPPDTSGLEAFTVAPGQTVTLTQDITAEVVGDNLVVEMSVAFDQVPASITATWHIEAGGVQVAPATGDAPLSEAILLPVAVNQAHQGWTIVISLSAHGVAQTWVDPGNAGDPIECDLGDLTIRADQVRCGEPFGTTCDEGGGNG